MTNDKGEYKINWTRYLAGESLSSAEAEQLLHQLDSDPSFLADCVFDTRLVRALQQRHARAGMSLEQGLVALQRRLDEAQAQELGADRDALGVWPLVSPAGGHHEEAFGASEPERRQLGRIVLPDGVTIDVVREKAGDYHLYLEAKQRPDLIGKAFTLSVGKDADEGEWMDAGGGTVRAELFPPAELGDVLTTAPPEDIHLALKP
jgi:hypothetical protein